jgi:hypothetical protein
MQHGARFFKNHIFCEHRSWKPILAAKNARNDPNLAPQDDPKSIKNRCQKTIEILIEKKTLGMQIFGHPGGMRWPPGEIIEGFYIRRFAF